MACNIGYRSYTDVQLPTQQPLRLRKKTAAATIDDDLLTHIGDEDPAFARWLLELQTAPFLDEALKSTLAAISDARITFSIENGYLKALASCTKRNRVAIEAVVARVAERFQIEVLAIVANLLEYKTDIIDREEIVSLRCEKKSAHDTVHRYIRITRSCGPDARIQFEHFSSEKERTLEFWKFAALAAKFGIPIKVILDEQSGRPIPEATEHRGFLKEGGK